MTAGGGGGETILDRNHQINGKLHERGRQT